MAQRPIACIGDTTSHGGRVVSGSPHSRILGRPVARLGDTVTCPRCRPHRFAIVEGSETHRVDGRPVARDGDRAACGAVLIAARSATTQ
ncbi:PAAR domain-containing protein [Aquincola sp. MAHUQ-54]|uniref:PAAR domain-containing protein n=1 Tax=Aquincola agrisoli TaxID=3119538 RepID=A0AAW9QBV0_9BURK